MSFRAAGVLLAFVLCVEPGCRREAASHAGGRAGRGGDLLYRWGNPRTYGRGAPANQRLFGPHDARWVPAGLPGAGHLTVFNNGAHRPGSDYSSVLEIEPPLESGGRYALAAGRPFGPERPAWEFTGRDRGSFFAEWLFEVTAFGRTSALIAASYLELFTPPGSDFSGRRSLRSPTREHPRA